MTTTGFTVALAVALAVAGAVHAQDSSGSFGVSRDVPANLRDGTATLEDATSWIFREAGQAFPGTPDDQIPRGSRTPDLNLDGRPDLLVETLGGGSGGAAYAAFLATETGYRYIGGFQGGIVPVARMEGAAPRVVISSNAGGGCSVVQLVELKPGMHRLARRSLAAGDSGTDEGRRLYRALFGAGIAPQSAAREVFGTPDRLETLLTGLVAKVPELVLAEEVLGVCTSVSASYETRDAGPGRPSRMWINIYTHDSPEEARQALEASSRRPTDFPVREEVLHGRAVYIWDKSDATLIRARAGRHVVSGDAPGALAGSMRKALQVLLEELEE